jgi:homoserine kinase type II
MSVYTLIERHELETFLADYDVGTLHDFSGITAGIENTNYFVTTDSGQYVLTLFEFTPAAELPFFLALMAHLAEHSVPSAHPLADREGRFLRELKGRPAALVMRLPGASVAQPQVAHCRAIGQAMARMHLATLDFAPRRDNDRGPLWRAEVARLVGPRLNDEERRLLRESVEELREDCSATLPNGVIHADLFRDNALFEAYRLTGIIDFYYAHNGAFIYDLAVAVADWCFDEDKRVLHANLASALLGAYAEVRPLSAAERSAWMAALRACGLRFWLSRLKDQYFPRDGALTHIKDPSPYKRILLHGRGAPGEFEKLLP